MEGRATYVYENGKFVPSGLYIEKKADCTTFTPPDDDEADADGKANSGDAGPVDPALDQIQ
jgi:hypothetical protein